MFEPIRTLGEQSDRLKFDPGVFCNGCMRPKYGARAETGTGGARNLGLRWAPWTPTPTRITHSGPARCTDPRTQFQPRVFTSFSCGRCEGREAHLRAPMQSLPASGMRHCSGNVPGYMYVCMHVFCMYVCM